jgi:hypothetical protein
VTADDDTNDIDTDIDRLYGVDPAEFTALRTELVAAARKRGDSDAVKRIAAARRPTTAAWVVNLLVRTDGTARGRLAELAERLRAAHAAMDGVRIRELSTAQRKLVDELLRTGFDAAGLAQPSAALRDDVVGTLQAAIAAPDVLTRLGSLTKAERWSGFGDFGEASAVGPSIEPKRAPKRASKRAVPGSATEDDPGAEAAAAAKERISAAEAEVDTAEREHGAAADELAERTSRLATARRRYEKLLETLSAAEDEVNTAEADHADAARRAQAASDHLDAAKEVLAQARSELDAT